MHRIAASILFAACACAAQAQDAGGGELFQILKEHDATFFERGFNRCDLDYLASAVHPQLRFYHDQGGFQDHDAFFENTRRYICADPERKPIRKVDADSLEVFPLYDQGVLYGAIQNGVHHFYLREPGKPDTPTSSARFTHVYVREDGRWLLKEVLSYDHRTPGHATAD
ncbi:nuclear transport factor 2 family protein [Marilutibacter chinensis]|uniref:Nuclear transport factor 2 family protein n=1 Tax=Marilutibacter chinensis TaxID=2912247 RepID=A0ABS9HVA3_9GAMM|nr:nuclear transport factor 2 family protein [Lysobacter chinensis]MCF7222312.1 nuclear transport factor 2 family protein [Lysobacter chinensis]